MKTIFLRFATILTAVFAFSCTTSDDGNPIPSGPVLVKKITETIHAGDFSETRITNFNYADYTLVSIQSGDNVTTLQYDQTGKVMSALMDSAQGEPVTITFTYNDDLLVSFSSDNEFSETTDFTYLNNVPATQTSRYLANEDWIITEMRQFLFYENNLVSQIIATPNNDDTRVESTFDTYHMPFEYMPLSLRLVMNFEGIDTKNANNPVTQTTFSPSTATTPSGSRYFEMQYNNYGYPVQIVKFASDGNPISTTLIEYL